MPQPLRKMTQCSESREEAAPPIALLTSKKTLRLGNWNVRTMYEAGKTAQIANEMKNYKISILGLSETRWTNSGQLRLASGETVLYSGHEDENASHTEGVALMLTKEAQRSLISWEAAGPRIIVALFKTTQKKIKLHIVQCYAPTNEADDDLKNSFYNRLQNILENVSEKDLLVVMGDMNAKVGADNTGLEEVMGKHGLGEMNENGERFTNLCASNNLIIGGSIFPHKRIHKATWISPDHVTENQIDHFCIKKKFRKSLLDVRVQRGADAASDHHLLLAKVKLKLKKIQAPKGSARKMYNVTSLKDKAICTEYSLAVSNRYQALQEMLEDEDLSVDQTWQQVKNLWSDECEKTLGLKKQTQKEWISPETVRKVEDRRTKKSLLNNSRTRLEKKEAQQKYTEAHKAVRRSVRADKRKYADNLAKEAEDAAAKRNMKALYDTTKKLAGKHHRADKPIRDKAGTVLTRTEDQLDRWREHFSELLNRPSPEDLLQIAPPDTLLDLDCSKPSKDEIRKAISLLRNGKAAGPDNVPAEAIKASINTSTDALHTLFSKIWEEEEIPPDWKEGYLTKIPKKGDLSNCQNYRGIMLLSVPGKVFNRVLLERIKAAVDSRLRDQQAGFRKDRSCTDHIATLRIIIEQSTEWNSPLYVNFIDYEKAFDSIDRNTLWKLMQHYGIPQKFITLIQKIYEGSSCKVMHGGQLTNSFEVKTGVRQGCLLSPFLFLLGIDYIMKKTTEGRRNGIQWTLWSQLDDLDFADDLALLSHKLSQMQEKTTCLAQVSTQIGLNIHLGKTKVLRINAANDEAVMLGEKALEEVNSFTYLGSIVNKQGGSDEDIRARIGKARAVYISMKNIWKSRELTTPIKIRLFNSNVKSVLLYGSETWRLTKTTTKKLQTFINCCLRRILRIHWTDHVRNEVLWERSKQEPIGKTILQRKWNWIGHTLRKPSSNVTRQSLTWNPQGKRKPGRPKNTWRRDLDAELRRAGYSFREAENLAQDRQRWREVVRGLCSAGSQGPK